MQRDLKVRTHTSITRVAGETHKQQFATVETYLTYTTTARRSAGFVEKSEVAQ